MVLELLGVCFLLFGTGIPSGVLTAFLSLMLAFMNLLPIPALDGGHVVFLLYEIAVGKPAPDKVMEYAQGIGMILLLGLLVFANGNDILKLF